MKRRSFLQKAVFGIGVLGFSSLPFGLSRLLYPKANAAIANYTILPGALSDPEAFIEACIGCGLCGEVCPPKCILFHKNDGGAESNKPYIDSAIKGCILCGYCMEICPTEALTVTPIREVDMGVAQIDRAACYPWVDKGVCGACVSVCPLGETAIDFNFGNFYRPVVKDGCVGCGLCVEVCPEPSLPIRIVQGTDSKVARHGVGLNQQYKWQESDSRLKF